MSPATGSAHPPAASISAAAVNTVPGELGVRLGGLGDEGDVGAVARGAQRDHEPTPRLPPEMKSVLFARLM
jgi:hypothetical protein